jgi:hypothetical protein
VRLKYLLKDRWPICAPLDSNDQTEVEQFLSGLDGNYEASRNGILVLMERFSKNGRDGFSDKLCHYVDKEEKIWEFIKGPLRVLWFEAGGQMIVCACGYVKKQQKADKRMVQHAIRLKHAYFAAVPSDIEFVEVIEE